MATVTIQLHRVLRAKPEHIYKAFLNADAMAKGLPPYGFTCTVHHLDAKVGGDLRMSFTNFTTGNEHSFGGEYLEFVPGISICYTDKLDDQNLPGADENDGDGDADAGVMRNRDRHRAGRHTRGHPDRDVLPRLAGVARTARANLVEPEIPDS